MAGYKAETGNFSGTTVTYTESKVRVAGEVVELCGILYPLSGNFGGAQTGTGLEGNVIYCPIDGVDRHAGCSCGAGDWRFGDRNLISHQQ